LPADVRREAEEHDETAVALCFNVPTDKDRACSLGRVPSFHSFDSLTERSEEMIGIDFIAFLILLIVSVVVSYVLHYLLKYYVVPGMASFLSKVVIGWVGAWLGSPVFGHWWEGLNYKEVYIIPAILGSLALLVFMVDATKTTAAAMPERKEPAS
jgi:uncharacterized membrane protein YeaQ/YmgE (transglycosylase-associated protein family)